MPKQTSIKQIPFRSTVLPQKVVRELVGYVDPRPMYADAYDWVDNVPFMATLTFAGFERGHSAAHAIFLSDSKPGSSELIPVVWQFQVFLTDLADMIRSDLWSQGKITGTFIGCKHGSNYGIMLHSSV